MFRTTAVTTALIALLAGAAFAQGNGRNSARNQGIPPGQMPPAGQCRVWYEGRAPGQQPRPTNCNEAERVASRSRNARVIYGSDTWGRNDRYGDRNDDRWGGRDDRNVRYGDRSYSRQGFDQGYRDGITKAQEDSRDGDRYDPARHDWYKSGNRGYDSRYGTREDYRSAYRSGFVQGYDNAYRGDSRTIDRDGDRDRDRQGDSIWERITGRNDGR